MAFQVGSAFLDACVLAVLARQDAYGYALTQRMREVVDISESTLYPVLRRLQKSGFLSTYDKPFQGRNRRYYKITDVGIQKYEEYRNEWIWHKARVDELMFGKPEEEAAAREAARDTAADEAENVREAAPEAGDNTEAAAPEAGIPPDTVSLKKEEKDEFRGGSEDE